MALDAVVLEQVTKRYNSVTAVGGLDLRVREGALFGLLGPNGAGKTTTLRMVMRMLVPDEGSIRIFDQPLSERAQDRIGYLPEERGLYPKMKVRQVLIFLGALKGLSEAEADRRALAWLERMELASWADRKIHDLSKGMQQKVQFIAAVLHRPPLLILDEPFAGLDPLNAALIKDIMLELRAQGATIILSTHRMEQVEIGKNTLRIQFTGDGEFLNRPELVESTNHFGALVDVKLRPGADSQEILRAAVAHGVRITRFELIEPPLNDIFIERVSRIDA
ncbi:MAG: ATP-binding cassette domain-containing protein [Terriglobia bacterium]